MPPLHERNTMKLPFTFSVNCSKSHPFLPEHHVRWFAESTCSHRERTDSFLVLDLLTKKHHVIGKLALRLSSDCLCQYFVLLRFFFVGKFTSVRTYSTKALRLPVISLAECSALHADVLLCHPLGKDTLKNNYAGV